MTPTLTFKDWPMRRLLFSNIILDLLFMILYVGVIGRANAQEPYSVGWAWSAKEVE